MAEDDAAALLLLLARAEGQHEAAAEDGVEHHLCPDPPVRGRGPRGGGRAERSVFRF